MPDIASLPASSLAQLIRFGHVNSGLHSSLDAESQINESAMKRASTIMSKVLICIKQAIPDALAPEFDDLFAFDFDQVESQDELRVIYGAVHGWLNGAVVAGLPDYDLTADAAPQRQQELPSANAPGAYL